MANYAMNACKLTNLLNMLDFKQNYFIVTVLSSCQSSVQNIKNLKKHLRKMAVNYNETAKTLKSKAENMTQWIQQQPNQQQNQSGRYHKRYIRHQVNRARMCRVVARKTMKMVKHIAEPKCDVDGNYERIQCESSGKWCWCVNENGRRVGSMKPLKKLNCSRSDKGRNQSLTKIYFRIELLHLSGDYGRRITHHLSQNQWSNQARILR